MRVSVNEFKVGKLYYSGVFGTRHVDVDGNICDERGNIQSLAANKAYTYLGHTFSPIEDNVIEPQIWLKDNTFIRATPNVVINRIKTYGDIKIGYTFKYKNNIYRKVASAGSTYGLNTSFILSEFGDSTEVE